MKKSNVNQIYNQYISKEISLEKTSDLLLLEIFNNQFYYYNSQVLCTDSNNDEFNEFIVWIYKKLPKLILNYKSERCTFLTYFTNIIRFYSKTYKRSLIKSQKREEVIIEKENIDKLIYTYPTTDYMKVSEDTIEYGNNTKKKQLELKDKQKKILLFLAIKFSHFMTTSELEQLQQIIGIPENKFYNYIIEIKEMVQKHYEKFESEKDKLTDKCISLQQKELELMNLNQSSYLYQQTKSEIETKKKIINNKRKKLKGLEYKILPKKSDIIKVLGIKRGNMDTLLRNLENKLDEIKVLLDKYNNDNIST